MTVHAAKIMTSGSEAHGKQINAVNCLFKRLNLLGVRTSALEKDYPVFLSTAKIDAVNGFAYDKKPFALQNLVGKVVEEIPINYANIRETKRLISENVEYGMCVAEWNGNIYVIRPTLTVSEIMTDFDKLHPEGISYPEAWKNGIFELHAVDIYTFCKEKR